MAAPNGLIGGAGVIPIQHAFETRGSLTSIEFDQRIPFQPVRLFAVTSVPASEVRGEHAHRTCHLLLVCIVGSIMVLLDDASERTTVTIDDPGLAVYIPPMTWSAQYGHSRDAVVIALASHPYDAEDYIRTYGEFLAVKRTLALHEG